MDCTFFGFTDKTFYFFGWKIISITSAFLNKDCANFWMSFGEILSIIFS